MTYDPQHWQEYLMDRIFNDCFWTAVDDFIFDTTSTLSEEDAEKLHTLLSEQTRISVEPPNENSTEQA